MGNHAILSPSGASKWLACPPSARLEQTFPDRAGEAAAEGTLAHAIAETMLKYKTGAIRKTAYLKEMVNHSKNKLHSDDMLSYMEDYTDYVMEVYAKAKSTTKDAIIFLETRLDMTDYVPEGFGTGDINIVADKILDFIDLKYGKGVIVSAIKNKQMMLYALGAYKEFSHLYEIETIRMTIYQPRLDNIDTWEIHVDDLLKWAKEEVKPKAQLAWEGKGEFLPGSHCTFCRAKPVCRAFAEKNLEVAKYDFAKPETLDDDEIADVLKKGKELASWVKSVQDYALLESVHNGKKWPGFKLVEGRSNRKYSDELKVVEVLLNSGFSEADLFTKKILGITAMEQKITKKVFNEKLGELIIKPKGSPTLVPQSDKRPEYEPDGSSSILDDFGGDFDE